MDSSSSWQPPDFSNVNTGVLSEIKALFFEIYHPSVYGDLAENISQYWISRLEQVWQEKTDRARKKDLTYNPQDPLSRIEQKTVLIAYADSVKQKDEPTLQTLESFLNTHFPAVKGLHMLPACEMSTDRFNDGGFSQIKRDAVFPPYGSNDQFEHLMETCFSMADFVLNHVDVENPEFQKYLDGDDRAGECFFVYSEAEYQEKLNSGDFRNIFRPRPFPLFTIFRRKPESELNDVGHDEKVALVNWKFQEQGLSPLPVQVINILYLFDKIMNDQMLLADDYCHMTRFIEYIASISDTLLDDLFTLSSTQETRTPPYIFTDKITCMEEFLAQILPKINISKALALAYAGLYRGYDKALFGERIRALTTFSHVQVDLNVLTFSGLKLLINDFSWYLKMDLNMLRLDAANFAFKRWGTSCFGLPEGRKLLKVLYLSMNAVSPRMVPNLEVNAPLSAILSQMADKEAPPPMMYDFHLASMLPVVFNSSDARPLTAIMAMVKDYDISDTSIRFSLDESHDGKSVNGSGGADPLLTYVQRSNLIQVVQANGGYVKYKSAPKYQYPVSEFKKVCLEAGLDFKLTGAALFQNHDDMTADILYLKDTIRSLTDITQALDINIDRFKADSALIFFERKILGGREPYELCVSTRDVLKPLDDPNLVVKRYLAFKTLSFALMGRHVKAIYFNDLMGLGNDHDLVEKTGELRNIKRTKSQVNHLVRLVTDPNTIESRIAVQMNHLIALVDSDPALNPRGQEAKVLVDPENCSVATVLNRCGEQKTLVVINISDKQINFRIQLSDYGLEDSHILIDNLKGVSVSCEEKMIAMDLGPFERLWLKDRETLISIEKRNGR